MIAPYSATHPPRFACELNLHQAGSDLARSSLHVLWCEASDAMEEVLDGGLRGWLSGELWWLFSLVVLIARSVQREILVWVIL